MASFEFKCRRCGKVELNPHCSDEIAIDHLLNAINGRKPTITMAPKMLHTHSCKDKGVGVSDLIGFKKG